MDSNRTPSDVVAHRVRELRKRRGMTTAELAERCAGLGSPTLTLQALYKLEGQRDPAKRPPRPVSVDELLVLAVALDVAPVHLLVPPYPSPSWADGGSRPADDPNIPNDDEPYPVTPATEVPCWRARQFINGWYALPGMDIWRFYGEAPPHRRPSAETIQRMVDAGPLKRWMTTEE